ncbi:MAG: hypothetical protein OER80_01630 [Gammaproteobacteria bacterium]|nr:hypothetical protein [Gammaproteobacteria bacterium]MDH3766917.1 hypothetical protein [Gammaproteobacteria bacterium]
MNSDQIESQQIVERYLRNELDTTETEQFENRLLWDTEMQDQLVLSQRLREGMRDVADRQPSPVSSRRWSFLESPVYAAAASVLLAVTTFGWLFTWLGSDSGDAMRSQASGRVFSLDIMRSSPSLADLPVVNPGTDAEWVTLLMYPDLDAYPQFRAELARQPGPPDTQGIGEEWQPVWQGAPTTSGSDTVAVTLQGALLEPGVHRLQVTGLNNDRFSDVVGEVYFRVPPL